MHRFYNYLLNKSNRYRYYKSEFIRLKQDNIRLENSLKELINRIDGKNSKIIELSETVDKQENEIKYIIDIFGDFPPGHFHSPINDLKFLKSREDKIWKPISVLGIEFNVEEQLNLFKSFSKYYSEMPFKCTQQPNLRYYFENNYYEEMDGTILYSMIRTLKPNKIIEVGSGFSSALMMDVNDLFFDRKIELTFIEPNPGRLYSLMSEKDEINNEIIPQIVQDVDLEKFKELEADDILFIDSSHVVKTGHDVQHILFEILPILKSGVYIHFHDIFIPYQYPKIWIFKNHWNWNEQYFLTAFLMYNNQFKIVLGTRYLYEYDNDLFNFMTQDTTIPYNGGSFWIKKI